MGQVNAYGLVRKKRGIHTKAHGWVYTPAIMAVKEAMNDNEVR